MNHHKIFEVLGGADAGPLSSLLPFVHMAYGDAATGDGRRAAGRGLPQRAATRRAG
jgi:hypothetical protein